MSVKTEEVVVEEKQVLSVEEQKNIVESSFYEFLKQQPFYGKLLQEINIEFTKKVPTLAISYNPKIDSFNIFINVDYLAQHPLETRVGLLYHEILHFTHNHLIRFMSISGWKENVFLLNVAGDMAINQFINHLPEGCIDVAKFKDKKGQPFPLKSTMEKYYDLLMVNDGEKFSNVDANGKPKKQPGQGQGKGQPGEGDGKGKGEPQQGKGKSSQGQGNPSDGSGDGEGQAEPSKASGKGSNGKKTPNEDELNKFKPHDEHQIGELTTEELENMMKEVKKIVQRTIEKSSFGHDLVPGEVSDLIEKINTVLNGINYKKIIRECIKRTISITDRENTWNRPSKRYGVYSPGTRCGKVPSLGMFIDTSGSISHTEMNEFLTFVDSLLKVGAKKCTLGLWHTDLYKVKKYKNASCLKQTDIESGGTDVSPTLKYISENEFDLNIVLTDGYFDKSRVNLKNKNILWVISKNGQENHPLKNVGKTVKIK